MLTSQRRLEFSVGLFMLVGLACLTWLAVRVGETPLLGDARYELEARFTSASGLKPGAFVELAGVRVGTVSAIEVDPQSYLAVVRMAIAPEVKLQTDAIASIRTAGIIGDKFVKLSPGGAEAYLGPGDRIRETEPAISLEELISKYIFESDR